MANTSAPYSEAMIASAAASLLDDLRLSSLDEETPLARFMAREFGLVRDELLRIYPWVFARKRALLSPLVTAPPFGWNYAYQLPTDYIRSGTQTDTGRKDGNEVPHEIEGRILYTNKAGAFPLKYIRRETDPAVFDPLFARALAAKLASYAATKVTGKMQYYQKAAGEFAQTMQMAAVADSLSEGTAGSYSSGHESALGARGVYVGATDTEGYGRTW